MDAQPSEHMAWMHAWMSSACTNTAQHSGVYARGGVEKGRALMPGSGRLTASHMTAWLKPQMDSRARRHARACHVTRMPPFLCKAWKRPVCTVRYGTHMVAAG